jgi:hypothetical protein
MAIYIFFIYTANLGLKNDLQAAIIKQEAAETSLRSAEQEAELVDLQLIQYAEKALVLTQERIAAEEQVDEMRTLFQDHDFANLVDKKPGLVENLMIKKTAEVFGEIETLTAP